MNWQDDYKSKVTTFEEVAHQIQSGDTIANGFGVCNPPVEMFDAILDRYEELTDVRIIDGYQLRKTRLYDVDFMAKLQGHITYTPIFGGAAIRQINKSNLADFFGTSSFFTGRKVAHAADVIMHMCTPPNKQGYINMGLAGFYSIEGILIGKATGKCRMAVGIVNDQMPVVFGNNWIHVSQFDYFIEKSEPVVEFARTVPGETEKAIGGYVAELINDGDTLQMGIGSIPEAVISKLEGKHDLGVLSEMFPAALDELVAKGIITNKYKPFNTGVSVASFCQGGKKLYDYIAENPKCELHPSSYTNDPCLIAKHPGMVTVNQAIMIDLSGQIASEGIGHRMISGPGGQLDFHFGAWMAENKPITVLTSAREMANGALSSSIVADFPPGTPISVTRALADNIITEYGIAKGLRNKSLRQKAAELIEIAHPDFRGELRSAMKKNFYFSELQPLLR